MRLGIDLDGVVADFDGGWTSRYAQDFGVPPRQAVPEWDALHRLTHFPSMVAFWEWFHDRALFRRLPPIAGAVEGLRQLSADHEIVILSSKPTRAIPDTLHWIADHQLPTREIHFIEQKHEIACDVYLDDAPHQVARLVRERPESVICRMVAPWNGPVPGAVDVTDWPQFVSVVDDHAAGLVGAR